jgi:hypothetical protein
MINTTRFPEYHPQYWDEEFEMYRNDIENWRNYQLEDQFYNPYTRDDMAEQEKRDIFLGYENVEPEIKNHNITHPAERLSPGAKGREKRDVIHHALALKPRYPQRGNTDPFSSKSWVY